MTCAPTQELLWLPFDVVVLQHPLERARAWSSTRLIPLVLDASGHDPHGSDSRADAHVRVRACESAGTCDAQEGACEGTCEEARRRPRVHVARGRRWRNAEAALDAAGVSPTQGALPPLVVLFPYPEAKHCVDVFRKTCSPGGGVDDERALAGPDAALVCDLTRVHTHACADTRTHAAPACARPILLVLDGTWSQVREMSYANPWLRVECTAARLTLGGGGGQGGDGDGSDGEGDSDSANCAGDGRGAEGSALRKEPAAGLVTTCEAVAAACGAAGAHDADEALMRAAAALAAVRNAHAEVRVHARARSGLLVRSSARASGCVRSREHRGCGAQRCCHALTSSRGRHAGRTCRRGARVQLHAAQTEAADVRPERLVVTCVSSERSLLLDGGDDERAAGAQRAARIGTDRHGSAMRPYECAELRSGGPGCGPRREPARRGARARAHVHASHCAGRRNDVGWLPFVLLI